MNTLSEEVLLAKARSLIEAKVGWGDSPGWTNQDFTELSERIFAETGVMLSPTTLKRVWGRVRYDSVPHTQTLNTLVNFVGYDTWRDFKRLDGNGHVGTLAEPPTNVPEPFSQIINVPEAKPALPQEPSTGQVRWLWVWLGTFLVSMLVLWQLGKRGEVPKNSIGTYSFSSRPVAKGLPNAVVFTYDATAAPPTDSVFIQQSWDPRRRVAVPREQHTHTSQYYYPGFFLAKLVVGNEVVREHSVFIPSEGWLVTIDREPVPIYVPTERVRDGSALSVTPQTLARYGIAMQPQVPSVSFSNVQSFSNLTSADFTYEAEVKSNYRDGSAACQRAQVLILIQNDVISIPLSANGCVGDLHLYASGKSVSAMQTDLSGFGSDLSAWTPVRCQVRGSQIQFWVNNRLAYTMPFTNSGKPIVGVRIEFEGAGAVRNSRFFSGK